MKAFPAALMLLMVAITPFAIAGNKGGGGKKSGGGVVVVVVNTQAVDAVLSEAAVARPAGTAEWRIKEEAATPCAGTKETAGNMASMQGGLAIKARGPGKLEGQIVAGQIVFPQRAMARPLFAVTAEPKGVCIRAQPGRSRRGHSMSRNIRQSSITIIASFTSALGGSTTTIASW